jgi:hypothetical protein
LKLLARRPVQELKVLSRSSGQVIKDACTEEEIWKANTNELGGMSFIWTGVFKKGKRRHSTEAVAFEVQRVQEIYFKTSSRESCRRNRIIREVRFL